MTSFPTFASDFERSVWVQATLKLAHKSFASIAREHGWHRTAVGQAMYRASDPQEKAIAEALGVAQRALFPERFEIRRGDDDKRICGCAVAPLT